MKKYKVCVYAICKNEEQFVERWMNSMKEADAIYVLDTGSTDKTVEKLKKKGAIVETKVIDPWRFEVARNYSLDMVPEDTDICVCTDLDEVLNPGWREALETVWQKDTTRCRYIYNWKLDSNDKPLVSFYYEKFHARKNYRWIFPVHEILNYDGPEEHWVVTDNIILNHYPAPTKSRSNYLKLLELSVKEYPDNDRNCHYLGREYMFHQKWNEAIDTLIRHLSLPSATWKDERAASMRFIARCYQKLNRIEEARMWLYKAIDEAPYLRDGLIELALLEYKQKNWQAVYDNCKKALKIEINGRSYINEIFTFDETAYDLLSLSAFYLEKYEEGLDYTKKALEINPDNERIRDNQKIIKQYVERLMKPRKNTNVIDKNFYQLIEQLKKLSEDEIFNVIKEKFLALPTDIQNSLEIYFQKFAYWGSLDHQKEDYEEIKRRANSLCKHLDDFVWLYENLGDYRSKKLLYAIMNNWYQYDFITLGECMENAYQDYFDLDLVHCNELEVFVDLGAYTGDSILSFLDNYNEQYQKIYAYEMTESSFSELKENVKKYPNIHCYKKAISDCDKMVALEKSSEGDNANKISDEGMLEIEATSLDKDIKDKISMIKMDIEGSEMLALKGAVKHIQNDKPKLLISVYHNHEDIWKVSKLIDDIEKGYQFYLRHHGGNFFPTEVTLIAIHKEKDEK